MYSIYFMKIETHGKLSFYCSDFWHPYGQRQLLIKKTERSDATILGTLGILGISIHNFLHLLLHLFHISPVFANNVQGVCNNLGREIFDL